MCSACSRRRRMIEGTVITIEKLCNEVATVNDFVIGRHNMLLVAMKRHSLQEQKSAGGIQEM